MVGYATLKLAWYKELLKLKNEQLPSNEKRTKNKLIKEMAQNISEYQTDNAYHLEMFTNRSNTSLIN